MIIFAVILLILSVVNVFVTLVTEEAPVFSIALCIFFTLYLMGIGR